MIKSRCTYTALLWLLLPRVLWHLFERARRQPAYREHLGERFGRYALPTKQPLIWIHAVSVGETRAAAPLIARLQSTYPQHAILLTNMTPTGRETARQLYGDTVLNCYLPYDFPFAVARFLAHFKPSMGILMETEIWFNLIHACHQQNLPLLLANARLSEKSATKYARFGALTRTALGQLRGIATQTEADAKRFLSLGATAVQVTGNLKFDLHPQANDLDLGSALRAQFGDSRRVLLAASTREGEEALLLDALDKIAVPDVLLVIVPRHPQRFDDVAALLQQRGIAYQRRSDNQTIDASTRVVLGDSMGEMFAYYAACDIAFIGGSLLPLGGQNLLEAGALGKPVLIGPHTFNFSEATALAIAAGAAQRVDNAEELAATTSALFGDVARMAAMGQAGKSFVAAHQGAAKRTLKIIADEMRRMGGA